MRFVPGERDRDDWLGQMRTLRLPSSQTEVLREWNREKFIRGDSYPAVAPAKVG
jgi:hypothetical protein